MSAIAEAIVGRIVTGVIALGPRSLAVVLGPSPRAYLWVALDRKRATLALAPSLPIPPDPRGSPFGGLETPLRGRTIREARDEARGGMTLFLASEAETAFEARLTFATDGPRVNLVLRSLPDETVLWALHRDELGAPATAPPPGFQAPTVEAADDEAARADLRGWIERDFRVDFEREIQKNLDAAERSLTRRIEAMEGDRARARERLLDRRRAEILLAHLAEVPRGASRVGLPDPYADSPGTEIEIALDPALSPHENAARLFRGAKRGERGVKRIEARVEATREALGKLAELRIILAGRSPKDALQALDDFLREAGLFDSSTRGDRQDIRLGRRTAAAPRAGRPGRRPSGARQTIGPRTFRTTDGWEIWVGKNDAENDRITHRLSNPHDFWLHAVGVPGSHVILRRPSRNAIPKPRTLEEAASVAAYYSKARKQTRVPVIYTERKFVSKPRRGKPGQALCTREREILVRPKLPESGTGTDSNGRREVSSE